MAPPDPAQARPGGVRWPLVRDGAALLALVLGLLFAIVVFLPAEGRIARPLHDLAALLLGRWSFLLPVGLVGGGLTTLLASILPGWRVPRARLAGGGLVAVGGLQATHLVGLPAGGSLARAQAHEGGGLVGHWLSSGLLEWLGGPGAALEVVGLLTVGTLLLFDVTVAEVVHAVSAAGQWVGSHLLGVARPRRPQQAVRVIEHGEAPRSAAKRGWRPRWEVRRPPLRTWLSRTQSTLRRAAAARRAPAQVLPVRYLPAGWRGRAGGIVPPHDPVRPPRQAPSGPETVTPPAGSGLDSEQPGGEPPSPPGTPRSQPAVGDTSPLSADRQRLDAYAPWRGHLDPAAERTSAGLHTAPVGGEKLEQPGGRAPQDVRAEPASRASDEEPATDLRRAVLLRQSGSPPLGGGRLAASSPSTPERATELRPTALGGHPAETQGALIGIAPPEWRAECAPLEPLWRPPSLDLFQARTPEEASAADLQRRSQVIEETLASFNIEARVVEANQGPAVTQFGIEPAEGVAVNRILSRQNDLALRLGASPLRLEAPVPGKRLVGVEVPNTAVATVTIRDVLESPEWQAAEGKLRLALGRDVSGRSAVGDLARMPHLLIAGATGAGKSVCINTIVGSLLYQFTPDELQLVMIDPKRVELVGFADVPHLRLPVVTDMEQVVGALKWVVLEMDRRYKLFARHGARNLDAYNRWAAQARYEDEPRLPYLVVVIDELADMMMTAADEVEKTLCRLAQLARATGIHLVVATQRPSVDVLTGLIKANFPTRIAFAVSSQTDSRVILDQAGAEKLLGRGDALYTPTDAMKPVRMQGAFVSDDEMQALVAHWTAQGGPRYSPDDLAAVEALGRGDAEDDDLYERACELAETVGRLSVSLLQRRLGIGRQRAERLLDLLVENGEAEA